MRAKRSAVRWTPARSWRVLKSGGISSNMNNRGRNARNTASGYSRNWPISLPASLGVVFLAAIWSTCASSSCSTVIACLTNPRCRLGNSNPHRRTNPRYHLAYCPKPRHLCSSLLPNCPSASVGHSMSFQGQQHHRRALPDLSAGQGNSQAGTAALGGRTK